jgi:hypothetical protein
MFVSRASMVCAHLFSHLIGLTFDGSHNLGVVCVRASEYVFLCLESTLALFTLHSITSLKIVSPPRQSRVRRNGRAEESEGGLRYVLRFGCGKIQWGLWLYFKSFMCTRLAFCAEGFFWIFLAPMGTTNSQAVEIF